MNETHSLPALITNQQQLVEQRKQASTNTTHNYKNLTHSHYTHPQTRRIIISSPMATSSHDKPATRYPVPQSTPAAYCAVPPSSYFTYYQQQQPTPTAYYTPSPPRPFTSTLLFRFLAAIAAAFTLIALITFTTWLVLNPQLPEFRVVSASVGSLNTTVGSGLSAQWDITLVATNPNQKLKLYYDSISAGLFYRGNRFLANTRYPPLLQQTRSENTVNIKFAVMEEFIGDDVARAIDRDRARGFVQFGVRLSAWLRFKSGILRSRYHLWEAVCYPLNFDFSSSNNGTATLMRALNCE